MERTQPKLILNPLQYDVIKGMVDKRNPISVVAGVGSGKTTALVLAHIMRAITHPNCNQLHVSDSAASIRTVFDVNMRRWADPSEWEHKETKGMWVNHKRNVIIFTRYYERTSTQEDGQSPLEGIESNFTSLDEAQKHDPTVLDAIQERTRYGADPTFLCIGVPVWNAHWATWAEKSRRGIVLRAGTHVNAANHSKEWLEDLKNMPPSRYKAMVLGMPQPPEGSVYKAFEPLPYPQGNIAPKGWSYEVTMPTYITGDWGLTKPSIQIIAYDEKLDAYVVVENIEPREVTVQQLAAEIKKVAWPRRHTPYPLGVKYLLDDGVGDKAGRARNDQTLRSTFNVLSDPPTGDGIGLQLRSVTSAAKTNIGNGVMLLQGLIEKKKILITQECWDKGISSADNSLAKAILSYRYKKKGDVLPFKDGKEDPVDALRYFAICFLWEDLLGPSPDIKPARAIPVKPKPRAPGAPAWGGGRQLFGR